MKHVLMIEQDILKDSQLFSLSNKKIRFNIQAIFDWNQLTLEDIVEIYKETISDLYEQWKKKISNKRSCYYQVQIQKDKAKENLENELNKIEKQDSNKDVNLSKNDSETDDVHFISQSTNEIDFQNEYSDRLNDELSSSLLPAIVNIEQTKILSQDNQIVYNDESTILYSIITDILNDRLTTETLAKKDTLLSDKNSQTSLLKLDKTTSTHSLLPNLNKQSNIFDNFYTDLFIFEKNTSRNFNLGKHEHWIEKATASYMHPFHTFSHQKHFYRYK